MRLVSIVALCAISMTACQEQATDIDGRTQNVSGPVAPSAKSATLSPDLRQYVGKYPFDAIEQVTFFNHPLVIKAVTQTVPDAAIRGTILTGAGPTSPIELQGGTIGSWACEAHVCGDHDWTIAIDELSGAATVCYHDFETMGERSQWFLPGGKSETRRGNCQ